MRFHWRESLGPLLIGAAVVLIVATDRYAQAPANPGAIILAALALAAFLGGLRSGLVSAALALAFAAHYFSLPGALLSYASDNLSRLTVLIVAAPAIALAFGLLRTEIDRALSRDQGNTAEVNNLHAALDQVDYGVALLDSELRAQFINRAFRRMWKLPDAKADSRPPFVALMYHGRDTKAYAVPDSELQRYVAGRVALVRAGHNVPIDIRLANGEVVRLLCAPLPDGGRMLSYVPVTDLFSRAQDIPLALAAE